MKTRVHVIKQVIKVTEAEKTGKVGPLRIANTTICNVLKNEETTHVLTTRNLVKAVKKTPPKNHQ